MLSGKRDSNSRPQPWQGCALPTELFPLNYCFQQHFLSNAVQRYDFIFTLQIFSPFFLQKCNFIAAFCLFNALSHPIPTSFIPVLPYLHTFPYSSLFNRLVLIFLPLCLFCMNHSLMLPYSSSLLMLNSNRIHK